MLGAVTLLATVVAHRARGMTLLRLPFFVWSQAVTALLLLLAFPALQAAAVFQLMDRVVGTQLLPADGPGREQHAAGRSRAAATRCCGSTCSGSSRIPRSTCSCCRPWASWRK